MRWWRRSSVQTKFTLLAMATGVTGFLLASAGIVTYEIVTARQEIARLLWILPVVLAASCLLGYLLSSKLQRLISDPILRLMAVARQVSTERDYTARAATGSEDELGQLVDGFNDMRDQIEHHDDALLEARADLEARVHDRTHTLELEILERRRTENELMLAKAAAEEANVAKSAFLANMSHELRTPLNAIIGYSEMMKEVAQETHSTEGVADVEKIIGAGRHLLALINDVLDLAKIEAGRMDLDVIQFDLADLVRSAVATSQPLAAARGNTLVAGSLEGLGVMRSDRTKIRQVLLNLLGNAAKYTEHGEVHLDVSRDAHGWMVMTVRDSGIGMTEAQVHRLFGDFVQADESTTRRYGGTGLGLAISQRLCCLLGGAIAVDSCPGLGSTFTVRLPVELTALPDAPMPAAPRMVEAPLPIDEPRVERLDATPVVLVIDDDANARELARRILTRAGYRVDEAVTADEGLRLMRSSPPDAIVLDVILPGQSGWSLLETLKQTTGLDHVPVVVVSVHDSRHRSVVLGAVDHLTKPFDADRLLSTLARCLSAEPHPATSELVSPTAASV